MQLATGILVILSVLVGCLAQPSLQGFTADAVYSNLTGVDGRLTAALSYDWTLQLLKNQYKIGPVEYFNFTARLRYLTCGSVCETETYGKAMPIYFSEASDIITGNTIVVNGVNCTERRKAVQSSGVTFVYMNDAGTICRAKKGDGSYVDFANVAATALQAVNYTAPKTCPTPACSKKIDFMLAFDESGSIVGSDFRTMKNFAASIANSYTWGDNYAGMGLVFFSTGARLIVNITTSKTKFIQQLGLADQDGGSTCIGCGLQLAYDQVTQYGRKNLNGTPVNRVFIVLTDGINAYGDLAGVLKTVKNSGVTIFAIGVGSEVDRQQITDISSNLPGINTTFFGDSFSALPKILDGLIVATCVDIPGNPCGLGCRGFCACRGNCICPDNCDDSNPCTDDSCTSGIGGNGCIHPAHDCDDGNACTADSCDVVLGCVNAPINCTDGNICTFDQCDPGYGCIFPINDCDDGSPCTVDTCNSTLKNATTGCVNTVIPKCAAVCQDVTKPVICTAPVCMVSACNSSLPGPDYCDTKPKFCQDTDPCTVDGCSNATGLCIFPPKNCDDGNACTIDGCHPNNGSCFNILIDVAAVCNDYNACTDDTCVPSIGCVNTNLTCSDGLNCTYDNCNSITGCFNPPIDCWSYDPELIQKPELSSCYLATCSESAQKCILSNLNGSTAFDRCGICNGDNSTCAVALGSSQTIGIGAGVIAAIVIGAVAICAVIGALGGKKGYDVWLKHRTNMQGANTNPMYSDNGLSGTNPMYSGDN